jgi:hypothetical protein
LGCRFALPLVMVLTASLASVAPCHAAGLVIRALNSGAAPGSTGSFDVVLINTNSTGGASYDLASNSLDIAMSGPAGVTITDVNMSTSATYIFAQSLDHNHGLPFATITTSPPGFTSDDSGDVANGYPGFQAVSPGQTYGLAHVLYKVSPTAAIGSIETILINSIGIGTSLTDNSGAPLSFTPLAGTLSVVPEPSTLIQGAIAAMIGLGAIGWRRRSSASRSVKAEAAGR